MHYKRIDRSEWQCLSARPGEPITPEMVRSACQRLSFDVLGLPEGGAAEVVSDDTPEDGHVDPWALLRAADKEDAWEQGKLDFDRTIVVKGTKPFHRKTLWQMRTLKDGSVKLSVEHRMDVSLLAWAAKGYQQIIKTGELP